MAQASQAQPINGVLPAGTPAPDFELPFSPGHLMSLERVARASAHSIVLPGGLQPGVR